jgi:hypothetical protein
MILARSLGHAHCTDFNVGGGLGVKYTPHDNPPAIQVITMSFVVACLFRFAPLHCH